MDVVLDNMEYIDKNEIELDEDGNVPSELLIPKHQLNELCSEAAKLKALGAMEAIPAEKVVRLLTILEINIRDGSKVTPLADPVSLEFILLFCLHDCLLTKIFVFNLKEDNEDDSRQWLELTTESINRGVLSSLTALHILTSQSMPKRVYLEDLIDRIVIFSKYQLQNTIFPTFDPVYRSGKGVQFFKYRIWV
jgi:cohesin loading factor subunit SCC2